MENQTNVKEFIILGFSIAFEYQHFLFVIFQILYFITISVNIFLINIIRCVRQLHKPMYFFLGNLSFLELGYISVTVPKIIVDITRKSISFNGCITQLFFFTFLGATETILLSVMSFDRFLAVCFPLCYTSIMSHNFCFTLAAASWVLGFLTTSFPIMRISQLHFYSANVINHFFCESAPLLKLSCSDSTYAELTVIVCASTVILSSVVFTLMSYGYILKTILKFLSTTGKHKTTSTCASHLLVVTTFYSTAFAMYVKPTASGGSLNKVLALLYSVVTPPLSILSSTACVIRRLKKQLYMLQKERGSEIWK